jgi:hypothetical protein
MRSSSIALATCVSFLCMLFTGCAPTLPSVRPTSSARLIEKPSLRTITVLPIDLAMEAEQPVGTVSPEASYYQSGRALPVIADAVHQLVARHGWAQNDLAWDGTVPAGVDGAERRVVIDAMGLANLVDWLVQFGYAVLAGQASAAEEPSITPLPLDSDATLFVGGYAHLREDKPHRIVVAEQAAIGVLIAVAIVGIVALLLASRGGIKLPGFGGGASEAALRALTFPVVVGTKLAIASARTAVDVARLLPPGHIHGPGCNVYLGIHAGIAYAPRPGPELQGEAKHANVLALGATLVENRTGRILWTAAQPMAIDPVDGKELKQAIDHLLADLPRAQ